MEITPAIIQGEFIGLTAKVAQSTQRSNIGIKGKVMDETRNTFIIMCNHEKKTIAKGVSVFHFRMRDGTVVEINGKLLVGRPEDRVKKRIRRLW